MPICADDSDCGTRKCDLGTGSCVDALPGGLPIGSPCTASSTGTDACNGFCLPLTNADPSPGFCSAACRYGSLQGCGYRLGKLDASAAVPGGCAVPDSYDGTAASHVGDVGLCLQLCDTPSDCLAPDMTCELATQQLFQHGVCIPADTTTDGGTPEGGQPEETGAPVPDAGTEAQAPDDAPSGD